MLVQQSLATTFTITQRKSNGDFIRTVPYDADTAYTNVDIDTDCHYAYIDAGTTVDIGVLTLINGPSSGVVHLALGTTWDDDPNIPTSASGRDLRGILNGMSNATLTLYGRIAGGFPGSNGNGGSGQANNGIITVNNLVLFKADGVISGTLTVQTGEATITRVHAQKVTSAATIRAVTGDIDAVHTTGNSGSNGEMAGLIKADAGNIKDVITDYGNLTGGIHAYSATTGQGRISSIDVGGDINSTALIGGLFPIRSYRGIGSIVANSINAKITTRADSLPFGTGIGRLESLTTRTGDLDGAIACAAIGPATGTPSYAVRVAGSLKATLTVDSSSGLQHQMICNGAGGSGTWNSSAIIRLGCEAASSGTTCQTSGSFTSFPYYTQASSAVGGSALGQVPFHLYHADCSPAIPSSNSQTNLIYLLRSQFNSSNGFDVGVYGAVKSSTTGQPPLRLYRVYTVSSVEYKADVTCQTAQTMWPGGNKRMVRVRGPGSAGLIGGLYLLTNRRLTAANHCPSLTSADLLCDNTTASPEPKVADFNIWFAVVEDCNSSGVADAGDYTMCPPPNCVADVDDGSGDGIPDGGVGIEDLLYYLNQYDMGTDVADVTDGTTCGAPDGGVGIEDLLCYLAAYDAGCP